ncbi:hypothetical protein [Paenibacillus nanensis]|uniref:hypothetical protein n=1 Tax=Paenibacillus nanensis TaxID=393251 RepID=UPI0013C33263|nr:hypothetical protein [Paenibacillus nanensis]
MAEVRKPDAETGNETGSRKAKAENRKQKADGDGRWQMAEGRKPDAETGNRNRKP